MEIAERIARQLVVLSNLSWLGLTSVFSGEPRVFVYSVEVDEQVQHLARVCYEGGSCWEMCVDNASFGKLHSVSDYASSLDSDWAFVGKENVFGGPQGKEQGLLDEIPAFITEMVQPLILEIMGASKTFAEVLRACGDPTSWYVDPNTLRRVTQPNDFLCVPTGLAIMSPLFTKTVLEPDVICYKWGQAEDKFFHVDTMLMQFKGYCGGYQVQVQSTPGMLDLARAKSLRGATLLVKAGSVDRHAWVIYGVTDNAVPIGAGSCTNFQPGIAMLNTRSGGKAWKAIAPHRKYAFLATFP